jgi:hypothetical protein
VWLKDATSCTQLKAVVHAGGPACHDVQGIMLTFVLDLPIPVYPVSLLPMLPHRLHVLALTALDPVISLAYLTCSAVREFGRLLGSVPQVASQRCSISGAGCNLMPGGEPSPMCEVMMQHSRGWFS